jgi:hypothetical protein
MKRTGRKQEWSIALFCTGLIFLFPPLLSIYNVPHVIFGLPVTYVVLYSIWALLIIAITYGVRRKPRPTRSDHSQFSLKNRQGDT